MKQGSLVSKLVMIFLFTAVILYLALSIWQSLSDPISTVIAYRYTLDDSVEATGYLIREEVVLPNGAGIVDIMPDEGEKLGAGQTVAVLYRDEQALERRRTIRSLELELDQLQYSLRQNDGAAEANKLDEEIFASMAGLRTSSDHSDFSDLDDQILSLKSLIFRREYTHNGDAAADIEALIQSVSAQISALNTAAVKDTTDITVAQSGVYSGLVDGYEGIFTPAALDGITVSGLNALSGTQPSVPGASVGKLITNSRWYLAALLPEADAARLKEGGTVTAAFSHDFTGKLSMSIEHVSAPENGQSAVVLTSSRDLSEISLLRRQTVDLIFETQTGIRIPKKALRIFENGTAGVYAVTGATAGVRTVTVLTSGEDFYLVASPDGVPESRRLHAGDEIILTAEELYDGKVIR